MLKKSTENPSSAFDQAALTALTGLFGGGSNVSINGLGDAPVMEQTETTRRLNVAITKLLKLDNNFVSNLEKLSKLAESKPAIYKMAVAQLMNL
jgi:hypothetical protein